MAKEQGRQTDRRQYALIAYLSLAVAMVLMTLLLAFTAEAPAMAQVTKVVATRTLSPLLLTEQAYVTAAPAEHQGGGAGGGRGQHVEATPTPMSGSGTATPSGANHDNTH